MKNLQLTLYACFAFLFISVSTHGQVVINEFDAISNTVELKNIGSGSQNVSSYRLCSFPTYNSISSLSLESGNLMMGPGDILVVSGHNMISGDDELGLYIDTNYGSSASIIDYVEWGSHGHQRSTVAEGAGIWNDGDFISAGTTTSWNGENDSPESWVVGTDSTWGEENFPAGCDALGGTITNEDFTICAGDGVSDEFTVMLEGNEGTNSIYVITDADANIIAAQPENVFDLEGAGAGVCLIWHLSYEDDVNLDVSNASELTGCYSLSNPLTVTRNNPIGGTITNEDFTMCAGDGVSDEFTVMLEGNEGTNSIYVITDADANIIAAQAENVFDLEGAGAGVCLIWHLSYEDDVSLDVTNAGELTGCYSLSNPLTVTRNNPIGGTITNEDFTMCAGDGVSDEFTVMLEGNEGTNSIYVITDADANIIAAQPENVFDLEGAGAGVCLIWHLSYEDDVSLDVTNAGDLAGCYSLSNPLTVTRNNPIGGTITNEDFTMCAGDGVSDEFTVMLEGNEGTNSIYVITDADANIIAAQAENVFDLEGAGAGVCLIWHLSYEDDVSLDVTNAGDLTGCYSLSNPLTVTRNQPMGGVISTESQTTICAGDGVDDIVEVTFTDVVGTNSLFVITDEDLNIIATQNETTFNLEGAGSGVCLIWHLSYEDDVDLTGITNAADITGCFSLSNPITVTRLTGEECDCLNNGGIISTESPTTVCAGDETPDIVVVDFEGVQGTNSLFVITDSEGNILGTQTETEFDFDGAGAGVCLIWHLSYEDDVDLNITNASELSGCFSLSNAIEVTRNQPEGGVLEGGPFTFCAGDEGADMIADGDITLTGNSGANSQWVVTFEDGTIAGLPGSYSDVDFDGAGEGTCSVWHISYSEGLTGLEEGAPVSELAGCFSLSNPIEVIRTQPVGGTLEGGPYAFCVGDELADMIPEGEITLSGNSGTNSQWVVTLEDGTIAGLPGSYSDVDFDSAGDGVCSVWNISYEDGLTGLEEGAPVSELAGCFSLSNPVEVVRTPVDGATVALEGGETEVTIIVGDGIEDVLSFENTSEASIDYAYLVTDADDNILAVVESSNNFEDAPAGECHVWGVSYSGELTAEVGTNISEVTSSECSDLSDNFVTVIRDLFDGIEEELLGQVSVYPSVVLDELNISGLTTSFEVTVMTADGKLVFSDIKTAGINTLDLNDLARGAYLVRISALGEFKTFRIIK